jgi:hypothetical protein
MPWKTIGAVFAGLLFVIVVTTLVDIVLHLTGAYGPWDQPLSNADAVLATSYRVVISVIGGWLTARLAPDRPMDHAMVLGIIGTFLGLLGVVSTWNMGMGPHWYPITLMVLAIPQSWLGGRLFLALKPGRS